MPMYGPPYNPANVVLTDSLTVPAGYGIIFGARGRFGFGAVDGEYNFIRNDGVTKASFSIDAADTLAQRNGTNAQSFRVYNTYTDAANYERAIFNWFGNICTIGTKAAGTGVQRNLDYDAALHTWQIGASDVALLASTVFRPTTNGAVALGQGSIGWKQLFVDYTNTGTVGAVTINKAAGRVNIAAAGTSVVVTNSLVTAASKVFAVVAQADATAYVRNVVPAAGSFTITLGAAATAQVAIDFFVVNAD